MKSLITNCNSNDQLLQLVSIQLLQKAHCRQLMFEFANFPAVLHWVSLMFKGTVRIFGVSLVLPQVSVRVFC